MPATFRISPHDAAFAKMKASVMDGLTSPESKRAYSKALDDFFRLCQSNRDVAGREFTKATANAYRAALEVKGLAASTINVRLSAIGKLAAEATDNGLMSRELASGVLRSKGAKANGVRTGKWLTREQAEQLLAAPGVRTMK